jgi:HEAT repeat protein
MQWLTRLLMIKDEERSPMLYYVALFVLLGVGLSLGRGSMAALFLKRYGIEYLPVMYAVLSVFMAVASITYAAYVDRVSSERLLVKMLGMLGVLIAACWGLMSFTTIEWVYPAYYLIYELASELLILHAKFYVDQNFDSLQLQRLSPPMFASIHFGKIVGGLVLGVIAPLVGVANSLLIWTALVAIPVILIVRRHRRVGISPYFRPGRKGRSGLKQSINQVTQGIKFFRKTALLRSASYAFFFMVISFFILNYSVDRVLNETFPREDQLAAFIGWLTAITGAMALLIQLLVTSRLLRRFGVTRVGLIFPTSAALSFIALLISFSLPAALIGIFSRDVIFPAIRKPTRMVFLHALPDYMLGRVNALSVGLVLPLALLVASGFLLLAQTLPNPFYFVVGGVFSSLLYLYFRVRANHAYTPALLSTLSNRLFLPHRHGEDPLHAGNEELHKELARGVAGSDDNMALAYARMMTAVCPDQAPNAITQRLPSASYTTRDRLLRLLITNNLPVSDVLFDALADTDLRLSATIFEALFDAKDQRAIGYVTQCLRSDNPRLAAIGVFGVYRYGLTDLEPAAKQIWEQLLSSQHDVENIAGLELLARMPDRRWESRLRELLQHTSVRVRRAALNALGCFPHGALVDFASALKEPYKSEDPELRALCVKGYRVLDSKTIRELFMQALEDEHHAVRDAALSLLDESEGRGQVIEIVTRWILENRGFPRAQQSALSALSRYRLPGEIFERIAETKAREASTLSHALRVIRREHGDNLKNDSVLSLLVIIFQERITQVLDSALMAMENFENPATIAAIRAGLASRERRHIAQACEALHNLRDHKLTGLLIALVDNTGLEKKAVRDSRGDSFQSARDVIAWCMRHPDSWLRECAARASPEPLSSGA